MPVFLPCTRNTRYCLPWYPRVAKAILPRVPCAFAETAHPSQPTSPEYMVDTSLTQSRWDPLEDVPPPLGHRLLMLHLPLHSGPHCRVGDPQSRGLHHHCPLPPHCQRCWVPQGHGVLAPTPIHTTPVRPSISAHCTPVWHHGEHHPYLPSRQPGRSAAQCQWRSVPPCPADGSSPPVRPFQCYPVNVHHFAVFHGSPRQEGHSHTAPHAVGWPLASSIQWSLRLLFLLGTCQLHQLCCSSSCS